jgi:hypothetical protein
MRCDDVATVRRLVDAFYDPLIAGSEPQQALAA